MLRNLPRTLLAAVAGAALTLSAGATSAQAQDIPESQDPIVLAIHEWTGQHITTYVAGHILESMGYNVEYVTAGVLPSASAVADGSITGSLELWDNNLGEFWPGLIEDGKVEDLGSMGLDAREGWLYPKHVEELCPGVPDWDAFLGCAQLFGTAETFPDGRFVEYPADWSNRATQLIEGEGLSFAAVPAGSEGALVAELNASVQKKSALVMMFWAPHWVLQKVDTGWIDIPQDLVDKYSLRKPVVMKVVWPGTKEKWPAAYRFLQAYQVDNDVQEILMNQIDNQGQDTIEVTKKWVEENEGYWKPFVDQATM
jgi:glycine betaine/proline transport system substrate-binding protein